MNPHVRLGAVGPAVMVISVIGCGGRAAPLEHLAAFQRPAAITRIRVSGRTFDDTFTIISPQRIEALVAAVPRESRGWDNSAYQTPPSGDMSAAFYQGDSIVGVLWIGHGFVAERGDSARLLHDVSPETEGHLRALLARGSVADTVPPHSYYLDSAKTEGVLGRGARPYLVVSGHEPEGGDYEGPVLYVIRQGDSLKWGVSGTPSPEYPGDVRDMRDSLVMRARAFVGNCIDSVTALVEFIHYRAFRVGTQTTTYDPWRDSTHVYLARGDSLVSRSNPGRVSLESVLANVGSRGCREIPGKAHDTPSDEPVDDSAAN